VKHRNIFPALILCLGMLNGCGAARPSKFYQLTVPQREGKRPGLIRPRTQSLCCWAESPPRTCIETIILCIPPMARRWETYEYRRWAEPPTEMINDVPAPGASKVRPLRAYLFPPQRLFAGDIMSCADAYTTSGRSTETACLSAWPLISKLA